MSMIGNFIRADEDMINDVQNGELSLMDLMDDDADDRWLDVDKAWHAIHYVLTGDSDVPRKATIFSKVVLGGTPIEEEGMGYGPALVVEPEEVREINEALKPASEEWFRERFSLKDMQKKAIYPVMDDEEEGQFFEYVYDNFKALKEFYIEAEKAGQGVLFFIT